MVSRVHKILKFAGLMEHAETPVKYYSAGMLKRLTFAITTEISPEIILNDEVFAGGDADFIHKAQKKMIEIIDSSHICVFASHSMDLIRKMTDRCLMIHDGRIVEDGSPYDVCKSYMKSIAAKTR